MMFKRLSAGVYVATRKDGARITVECTDYTGDMKWRSSQEGDFYGHHTGFYATKKEAVFHVKNEEAFL